MSSDSLSASEAADRLGISHNTLKSWFDRSPSSLEPNAWGEQQIDRNTLDLLATIQDWRTEGSGVATITKRLKSSDTAPLSLEDPETVDSAPTMADGGTLAVSEVIPIVQEMTRLTMALSKACFRQGQLEQQVRDLEKQADKNLNDLFEGKQREKALQERTDWAEAELASLREKLTKRKPWWKRLFA